MHSMWSGVISFGLVNIPIKLYAAVDEERLHLNYLRKDDLFEKLRKMIEEKKAGKPTKVTHRPKAAAPGRDILAKLKESLAMAEK